MKIFYVAAKYKEKTACLLAGILSLFFITGVWAQNTEEDSTGMIETEASYIGDVASNFAGGISSGTVYMGMANLMIGLDLEKTRILKGAKIYLKAANIHGSSLSGLIGDIQVASNIDAGNHTYVQELWFSKSFGNLEIIAGLQDLNAILAVSDHGSLFVNSSFGILPTISLNTSAPIFPLTTLGLTAKWNINDRFSWVASLHDGSPMDFESNPYNLKWGLHKDDGLLASTEFQYYNQDESHPGTYKLGLFSEYRRGNNHKGESAVSDTLNNSKGIYFYGDQQILSFDQRTVCVFIQTGYSPKKSSTTDLYIGGGLHIEGIFSKSGKDILGLAVGNVHLNNSLKPETVMELTYQYTFNNHFFIQPDLQYSINPAGTGANLENSMAGILRFGIVF